MEEGNGMTSELFSPLSLRSGQALGNRIAKAAMEENMAGDGQLPDEQLFTLYRRWAAGGTGLLITGNVMVHAEALTGPGGVVLDEHAPLKPFSDWAKAGKSGGGAIWMQINHPGRQVASDMGAEQKRIPASPSVRDRWRDRPTPTVVAEPSPWLRYRTSAACCGSVASSGDRPRGVAHGSVLGEVRQVVARDSPGFTSSHDTASVANGAPISTCVSRNWPAASSAAVCAPLGSLK
ncbi:hypothetical protein [Streptomyces longhuiensis]|uniref:oxidoreductase n=1 Tax=Streptomyces longhuiensis TaxID=2880933 RepID=UPI003C6F72F4